MFIVWFRKDRFQEWKKLGEVTDMREAIGLMSGSGNYWIDEQLPERAGLFSGESSKDLGGRHRERA